MRKLVFLSAARADLLGILTYLARESGSIATGQRFVARLRGRCTELATLPGLLGRARPELHVGLRSVACNGYVIFFRYVDDRLEVVNILEGHRDIGAHFSGPR